MKLSILIPTHNRPELFKRCIGSIIPYLDESIEVIVNNDSDDITEITHQQISYHYNKYPSLCNVYEALLFKATGEYVWYVEDDDYLTADLGNLVDLLSGDIIVGNYYPQYSVPNKVNILDFLRQWRSERLTAHEFVSKINVEHLQLGQYIFRRELIVDYPFASDNNVHNDLDLVLHCASKITGVGISTLSHTLYYQTVDGGDNISFNHTNPSVPTIANYDFLRKYPPELTPAVH